MSCNVVLNFTPRTTAQPPSRSDRKWVGEQQSQKQDGDQNRGMSLFGHGRSLEEPTRLRPSSLKSNPIILPCSCLINHGNMEFAT